MAKVAPLLLVSTFAMAKLGSINSGATFANCSSTVNHAKMVIVEH
jgi:hypothetical protein